MMGMKSDQPFFFKQKTAYELRISGWSSDVCSSDLRGGGTAGATAAARNRDARSDRDRCRREPDGGALARCGTRTGSPRGRPEAAARQEQHGPDRKSVA